LRAFCEIGYNGTLALDLYSKPTPIEAARRSAPAFASALRSLQLKP
jgi:hypothetical protein